MTEENTEQLIRRLLHTEVSDGRELDRIYRLLSKRLHPDTGGGDGSRFVRLHDMYERSKSELRKREIALHRDRPMGGGQDFQFGPAGERAGGGTVEPFDPYFIVLESGFGRELEPRGCLYLSLNRFFSLGLQNYRVRSMKSLKKRNSRVMKSIFHWSYIYDPVFPPIFAAYARQHLQFLSTTQDVKNYNFARRLFSDGISVFFTYQQSGRKGTLELAEDKFSLCERVLLRCVGETHPLLALVRWFAVELEKPPLQIHLS
jgi:hypothetical protein